ISCTSPSGSTPFFPSSFEHEKSMLMLNKRYKAFDVVFFCSMILVLKLNYVVTMCFKPSVTPILLLVTFFNDFCRHTTDYDIGGNIFCNYCSCCHNASFLYSYPR